MVCQRISGAQKTRTCRCRLPLSATTQSTASATQLQNELKGKLEIGVHCSVSLYDAKKNGFVLTSTNPDAQYILYAPDAGTMEQWMSVLKEAIAADQTSTQTPHELKAWLHVKGNKRFFVITPDDGGVYHLRWYTTTRVRANVRATGR